MLQFQGVLVRARFGVYENGELVDQAVSEETAVFTSEQFEQFMALARAEAEKHNAQD